MTEADHAPDDAADRDDAQPPSTAQRLIALQLVDTQADQLTHRRERLPEREELEVASGALAEWERTRAAMQNRMDELTGVIDAAEQEAAEIATHKERLEAQMKTVIAPREAEALMHEIATLDEQTDALDLGELEALEEQSLIDDRLTEHLRPEGALRDAVGVADRALRQTTADVDRELAQLATDRSARRGELSAAILARYDRVRASSGVAVARLVGHRCDGCHLDLSAAEVDDVKDEAAAADGVADCPNCGRMLAV